MDMAMAVHTRNSLLRHAVQAPLVQHCTGLCSLATAKMPSKTNVLASIVDRKTEMSSDGSSVVRLMLMLLLIIVHDLETMAVHVH